MPEKCWKTLKGNLPYQTLKHSVYKVFPIKSMILAHGLTKRTGNSETDLSTYEYFVVRKAVLPITGTKINFLISGKKIKISRLHTKHLDHTQN